MAQCSSQESYRRGLFHSVYLKTVLKKVGKHAAVLDSQDVKDMNSSKKYIQNVKNAIYFIKPTILFLDQ